MAGYILTSKKQDWETPQWLYDRLNDLYQFDVDLACTTKNCKASAGIYHDRNRDSLCESWNYRSGFLNPPYGAGLEKWLKKAVEETESGNCGAIVALIPASTEIKAWQKYVWHQADVVTFLYGRVRFELGGKPAGSNVKGSALVVYLSADFKKLERDHIKNIDLGAHVSYFDIF